MAKEAAALIGDGFGADRGEAEVVVGFVEGRTPNADRRQPIDHLRQLNLIDDRQHDEMTTVVGLKMATRLKAGVTDLDNLIGQGQVGANQRVNITCRSLLFRHGR